MAADDELTYTPFCDDFGPTVLDKVFRIYEGVQHEHQALTAHWLVLVTEHLGRE